MTTYTPDERLAINEMLDNLRNSGFANVLDALSDEDCYTQRGKLNVTALGRKLKLKPPATKALLTRLREHAEG
jgi:hypothetical protein